MAASPGLKRIYNRLNKRYFNSELPNIPLVWKDCKDANGICFYKGNVPIRIELDLSLKGSTRLTQIVLLHEMAHCAKPKAHHGPVFQKELMRLVMAGAYDTLL